MFVSSKLGLVGLLVAMTSALGAGIAFIDLDPPIEEEGEVQWMWSIDEDAPAEDSDHPATQPIQVKGTRAKNQAGLLRIFSVDGGNETNRSETTIATSSSVKSWTKNMTPSAGGYWPTTSSKHPYVIKLYSKNPGGGYNEEDSRAITVTL
jgi:hypothetical protein